MQVFGLDSMHDGAWFANAMLSAQRIDPEGGYLASAMKYQLPFYLNVITAHLIQLISAILMDRAGTTECDLIRKQAPAKPIPVPPLPDRVLRIQGLK